MDPTETLRRLREEIKEANEAEFKEDCFDAMSAAIKLFESLDEWLSKGGFAPSQWPIEGVAKCQRT